MPGSPSYLLQFSTLQVLLLLGLCLPPSLLGSEGEAAALTHACHTHATL